ncbi:conserved domain protein [Paraprevotella xylaniphila YIT 11841]|uniref:Conserved domain protein n=1 Tax=Paraprevotella xylaniphila YIT 11841 TaxID=762982 RepID=F3QQG9_9BACT|nr:conserved domain protein [Paraprevotella xylaniphila YIT 11841]
MGLCRKGRNKPLSLTFGLGGNSYGCVIFRPDRIRGGISESRGCGKYKKSI